MDLKELAARLPQEPQEAPRPSNALDALTAQRDAGRLHLLQVQTQAALDGKARPADLLAQIIGDLYGSDSPQAAAVAAILDADRRPGGPELALMAIKARRKLLQRQRKQLEEQARAITGELERLDAEERELARSTAEGAALDRALLDVLTFTRQPDGGPDDPQRAFLDDLQAIYDRHHGNPAAMGLLYGSLASLAAAQGFDMVQVQAFTDLQARIKAAAGL